jgi:hypothetical protein
VCYVLTVRLLVNIDNLYCQVKSFKKKCLYKIGNPERARFEDHNLDMDTRLMEEKGGDIGGG